MIVEQGIKGREIECAVLGNDNPQASTCGEIVLTSDFYAYDTKYIDEDGAKVVVPAAIAREINDRSGRLPFRLIRRWDAQAWRV